MAQLHSTKRATKAQVDARVYERFECRLRLREGDASSAGKSFEALEVQARSRSIVTGDLPVAISLWTEAHFFSGLAGNVAHGGVFISTCFPLVIGSYVELDFSRQDSDLTLHACGQVRWMREFSKLGPRGIGIAFETLSEEDRRRMDEFCLAGFHEQQYADVG